MSALALVKSNLLYTEGFERICSHDISWHLKGDVEPPEELDECSIEHIQNLLIENYREGELCCYVGDTDQTFYGWWSIQTGARI
jgi:hypothetical protein